jgi:hypothetical protein
MAKYKIYKYVEQEYVQDVEADSLELALELANFQDDWQFNEVNSYVTFVNDDVVVR